LPITGYLLLASTVIFVKPELKICAILCIMLECKKSDGKIYFVWVVLLELEAHET